MSRSDCTELNMSRNGVYRSGHVPKHPARPAPPEQNSVDSSRIAMSTSVAKVYSHFKVPNVNKVAIFYGIILIPLVCCSHGSHMYSKASNVLEYNYAVRVPSNVLEWYPMFSMFSKTKIMKKPILFVIFVSVW